MTASTRSPLRNVYWSWYASAGSRSREEVAEQQLPEPASRLRRAERLLQPGQVAHALVHLRGRLPELAELRADPRRGRRGGIEPPVEGLVEPAEAAIQLGVSGRQLIARVGPQALELAAKLAAQGADEPRRSGDEADKEDAKEGQGDHGPRTVEQGVGRRPAACLGPFALRSVLCGLVACCGGLLLVLLGALLGHCLAAPAPSPPVGAMHRPSGPRPPSCHDRAVCRASSSIPPCRRHRGSISPGRGSRKRRRTRYDRRRVGQEVPHAQPAAPRPGAQAASRSARDRPPPALADHRRRRRPDRPHRRRRGVRSTSRSAAAAPRRTRRCSDAGCTIVKKPAQGRQHVPTLAKGWKYNTFPPTTGPHFPSPAPYDFYSEPVQQYRLVHNLEHGSIVIQYGSDVPQSTVSQIRDWYLQDPNGIVVAPFPALKDKVVLEAWTAPDAAPGQTPPPGEGIVVDLPRLRRVRGRRVHRDVRLPGPGALPAQHARPGRLGISPPGWRNWSDAPDLKSGALAGVRVRVPPPALAQKPTKVPVRRLVTSRP